jgi:hypothetical protein
MGRCGVMLITVGFEMPFLNADTRHCLGTAWPASPPKKTTGG